MANRGLQLGVAEEQRRALNSIYAAMWQLTLILLLDCWRSKHHLGVAYAQRMKLCAGVNLQHRAQQHWLPGMEMPLLSSPLPILMLLLRTAHELAASSSLGQANSETIPCIPSCALMRGADFCSLQVTLGLSKQQVRGQNVAVVAASPAARDSKLYLGSDKVQAAVSCSSGFKVFVQISLKLVKDFWCCNGLWIWPQVSVYNVCLLLAGLWVWNSAEQTFGEYIECANLHNDLALFKAIWFWIYVEIPPSML